LVILLNRTWYMGWENPAEAVPDRKGRREVKKRGTPEACGGYFPFDDHGGKG